MKSLIRPMILLGLLFGGALLAEKAAEACMQPAWYADGGICNCNPNIGSGYSSCWTNGNVCFISGSGCGGGPGRVEQ